MKKDELIFSIVLYCIANGSILCGVYILVKTNLDLFTSMPFFMMGGLLLFTSMIFRISKE